MCCCCWSFSSDLCATIFVVNVNFEDEVAAKRLLAILSGDLGPNQQRGNNTVSLEHSTPYSRYTKQLWALKDAN